MKYAQMPYLVLYKQPSYYFLLNGKKWFTNSPFCVIIFLSIKVPLGHVFRRYHTLMGYVDNLLTICGQSDLLLIT